MLCVVVMLLLVGWLLIVGLSFFFYVVGVGVDIELVLGSVDCIVLWLIGQVFGEQGLLCVFNVVECSIDLVFFDCYIDNVDVFYLVVYWFVCFNGIGLLVIFGGGYQCIVLDKEGIVLVLLFVVQGGVMLFVLCYWLLVGCSDWQVVLVDVQCVMWVIWVGVVCWQFDLVCFGVMGFFVGGYVVVWLSIGFDLLVYFYCDVIDVVSVWFDVVLLIYLVIDMGLYVYIGLWICLFGLYFDVVLDVWFLMQEQVCVDILFIFLVYVQDDIVVFVYNSLVYYQVLLCVGVFIEMYLFLFGGYGFGVCIFVGFIVVQWFDLVLCWIFLCFLEFMCYD